MTMEPIRSCPPALQPTEKTTFQTATQAMPDLCTRRQLNGPLVPDCDDDDDDVDLAAIEALGRRVRFFMGSMGAFVVLFAVLAMVLPFFTKPLAVDPGFSVCNSRTCALYGMRLSNSVNESSEPCTDFYEFACGGWSHANAGASTLTVMADAVLHQLASKLRDLSATNGRTQTAVKKAAILYETCEAVVRRGKDELAQLLKILDDFNLRWPRESRNPKLLDTLINLSAQKGYNPFFELRYEASSYQLFIDPVYQLKTVFEMRTKQRNSGRYWSYYTVYCTVFGIASPLKSVFDELVALESAAVPDIDDAYLAAKPVARYFVSLDKMVSEMGGFSIREWWDATTRHVGLVRSVNVTHWHALKVLGTLAASIGNASLYRCLEWWIVQDLGPWFHGDLAALEYGDMTHAYDLRPRQCLGLVERLMGVVAWAPISTPVHVADDVTHVVHAVWKAARDSFGGGSSNGKRAISLLAPEAPPAADFVTQGMIEKMASMYEHYPPMSEASFAENFVNAMATRQLLRTRFHGNTIFYSSTISTTAEPVEVCSGSQKRKMVILPYSLSPPLYEDGIVASVKFAGLGTAAADAMFKNATSSYMSSHGGVLPALLTDYVTCLRASHAESDKHVATRALDQVSRAFALESSWRAFRAEALLGSGREDLRLENFDGYSAEKTFFVTWCHVLCSTKQPDAAKHSCNEAIKQSSDFSQVFRCNKADAMVRADNCRLLWAADKSQQRR